MFKPVIAIIFVFVLLGACSSAPSDPVLKRKEQAALLARCSELIKEIDALKGSPVRRNAAREYYASECLK